jgi:hypothetical protein
LPEGHPDKPQVSFDVHLIVAASGQGGLTSSPSTYQQGFLSETISRVQASVATELATAPGYEVAIFVRRYEYVILQCACYTILNSKPCPLLQDFIGAGKVATLRVPTIEREAYWIGAFGRWTYLFMRDLSEKTKVD